MPTITLSSKNQITLPVEMVRALGLKAGEKLDIELISDRLVIWPKPRSYAEYFAGRLKGVWGSTVEEVDRYVAEERASWERGASTEEIRRRLEEKGPVVFEVCRQVLRTFLMKEPLTFGELQREGALISGTKVGTEMVSPTDIPEAFRHLVALGYLTPVPTAPVPTQEEGTEDQVPYRLNMDLAWTIRAAASIR